MRSILGCGCVTKYQRKYSIPTDAITKKTFDREVDRNSVARETEQRKRLALADRVRVLAAVVAELHRKVYAAELEEEE